MANSLKQSRDLESSLNTILQQSRSLSDRIARYVSAELPDESVASISSSPSSHGWLERWKNVFEPYRCFEQRLRVDGLTAPELPFAFQNDLALNHFECSLRSILLEGLQDQGEMLYKELASVPFSAALCRFANLVHRYWQRATSIFNASSLKQLYVQLVKRLSEIAWQSLYSIFNEERIDNDNRSGHYQSFVDRLNGGDWIDVFVKYPVLARLIAAECDNWQAMVCELDLRVRADEDAIRELIFDDSSIMVDDVKPCGDMHNGRCVLSLTINGRQLMYKPRPMGLDVAFDGLIEELSATIPEPYRLDSLKTLDRGEYGYQRFVKPEGGDDTDVLNRQGFIKYGALLGLLYLLKTTDGHYENFVVSNGMPYFIDAETLFHPDCAPFSFEDSTAGADDSFIGTVWQQSVQRVGMLPGLMLQASKTGHVNDFAALANTDLRLKTLRFIDVNQDSMRFEECVEHQSPRAHQVCERSFRYRREIQQGFDATCEHLVGLAKTKPDLLDRFRNQSSRFLFRNTGTYAHLINISLQPENLVHGITHSLCFEPLAIPFCVSGGLEKRWPIYQYELRQLETLDVPRFQRNTSNRSLLCDHCQTNEIECFFAEDGLGAALKNLQQYSDKFAETNHLIIEGGFRAAQTNSVSGNFETAENTSEINSECKRQMTNSIEQIVKQIVRSATMTQSGIVNWLSIQHLPGSDQVTFGPLDDSLYKGRVGIGLFLALVSRLEFSGSAECQEIAVGCTNRLANNLLSPNRCRTLLHSSSIGLTGVAGTIYGLLGMGRLLKNDKLVSAALAYSTMAARSLIGRYSNFDFFVGVSGLLFSLCRVARFNPKSEYLSAIETLADHLAGMESAAIDDCGLAHGGTGIGWALWEAFRITSNSTYELAAIEFISSDVRRFEEELVAGSRYSEAFSHSLCRGRSGIELALSNISSWTDCELKSPALSSPAKSFSVPSLCCGASGVWMANRRMDGDNSTFLPGLCIPDFNRFTDPSLFRGLAGVGWGVLAQLDPTVPGVLELGGDSDRAVLG